MYDALTAFQRFMDGNALLVWGCFFLALTPVLPVSYRGVRTDGWHALSALRGVEVDHQRIARGAIREIERVRA